jgi:hypothetical protein
MSFSRSTSFGSSTPLQPAAKPLYPSFNVQTPTTPSPSLQQKPPPRPASVPLSFGGGLSHSASTPSLSQASQHNQATEQPQQPFPSSAFSPSPQPPLTTYDLAGNSPFSKPPPQWGQQLGGQGLTRSHSQQFMPQGMGNPLGERRYLPSHLRVLPRPKQADSCRTLRNVHPH